MRQDCKMHHFLHHFLGNNNHRGESMLRKGTTVSPSVFCDRDRRAKSDRVVRTIQRLSPGQRTGYVVMNETEVVRKEGMHHPLRIKVGVKSVGVAVT